MGLRRLTDAAKTRRAAWWLSLAGLIPFALCVAGLLLTSQINPQRIILIDAMKTYGAVILSFLGGIRWGAALHSRREDLTPAILAASVVPSLAGWMSLLLPVPYVFGVQALAFAGQGAWDSLSAQQGALSPWFAKLRTVLTFLVTGAMITAFFATV